jgi:periplasmic divalent cation tolerance protein
VRFRSRDHPAVMVLGDLACRKHLIRQAGSDMERVVSVCTTYSSLAEADRAGQTLVERRLAASVSILPRVFNHSWRKGAVERSEHVMAMFHTRIAIADALRAAIRELHPSVTPSIYVIPIEESDPGYHAWIVEETTTV